VLARSVDAHPAPRLHPRIGHYIVTWMPPPRFGQRDTPAIAYHPSYRPGKA
jgi:hypothetical protein